MLSYIPEVGVGVGVRVGVRVECKGKSFLVFSSNVFRYDFWLIGFHKFADIIGNNGSHSSQVTKEVIKYDPIRYTQNRWSGEIK